MPDGARLVAVPVDVAEPGNAGTVIRVADAVGADAVLLAGDAVDPMNGKVVRASAGSVFHLPVVQERDAAAAIAQLKDSDLTVLATAADGEVSLDDADELLADGAGGVGYLLKDRVADVDQFLESVQTVGSGGTVLDPEVLTQILVRSRRREDMELLSPREREVLGLMMAGVPADEAGRMAAADDKEETHG